MTAVWIVTGIAAWIALSIATALILSATIRRRDTHQAPDGDDNGGHDEPKSGQRP